MVFYMISQSVDNNYTKPVILLAEGTTNCIKIANNKQKGKQGPI